MEPTLVQHPGALLHGLMVHTTLHDGRNVIDIPTAWQKAMHEHLFERIPHRQAGEHACFGAVTAFQHDTMALDYLIGVEVTAGNAPPDGLAAVALPAGEYAVFLSAPAADQQAFGAAISACWDYALSNWLPRSGRSQRHAPCFERYDERSDEDRPDRQCELWIPLDPR